MLLVKFEVDRPESAGYTFVTIIYVMTLSTPKGPM